MEDNFLDPIPGKAPNYEYPGKLSTEIFYKDKSKDEPDFAEGMKEMLKPLKNLKELKIILLK